MTSDPLPNDLVPRTTTLLARGAAAALIGLVVYAAAAGVILGVAAKLQAMDAGESAAAHSGGFVRLLVALPAMALFTTPLVAFALASKGEASLGATLGGAWSIVGRLAGPCLFDFIVAGTLLVGSGLTAIMAADTKNEVMERRLALVAAAAALAAFAARFHGSLVLTGAHVALDPKSPRARWAARVRTSLVAGMPPVLVLVVVGANVVVRYTTWIGVPAWAFQAAATVALLAAHVVSSAFAVAVASRSAPSLEPPKP